jgi:hypothetical protein
MNAVRVRISWELLCQALNIRGFTSVVHAVVMADQAVEFVVEGPDLPLVKEGEQPVLANPTVTYKFDWGV